VADSTGNNPRQLTHEDDDQTDGVAQNVWSPDGKEFVYTSRRTGTGDVWIMPVNGDSARQLTRDVRDDYAPALSADGKWVAFLSDRGRQTDVWVVPAAGGTELRITDDEASEGDVQWVGREHKLAYHTGQSARRLVAISVADGSERTLTPDSIRVGGFDVSLDGQQIVYQIARGGGVSDLAVVPVAGGEPRTIVTGTADNYSPQWSPDGKRIVFLSTRSGTQHVWMVDGTGGTPRQLTDWSGFELAPQWSRDGKAIYFFSSHESTPLFDIWSMSADGGTPKRITTVGTVQGLTLSRNTPDIMVSTIGAKAGQIVTNRLMPDGSLRPLWDQGSSYGTTQFGFFAGGDSLGITADLPTGGRGSFLISKQTGKGHRILESGGLIDDVSPDGSQAVYRTPGANPNLALYSLKDGSTRRLTNTPESDGAFWWAGPSTIVVNRTANRRRIAVVDLTAILQKAGAP